MKTFVGAPFTPVHESRACGFQAAKRLEDARRTRMSRARVGSSDAHTRFMTRRHATVEIREADPCPSFLHSIRSAGLLSPRACTTSRSRGFLKHLVVRPSALRHGIRSWFRRRSHVLHVAMVSSRGCSLR